MPHQQLRFNLNISSHEILKYYRGNAQQLKVKLRDNRIVQIPLKNFRPFITHDGLHGEFVVEFNELFKLVSLKKLGD